jgi:outer membrane protein OmpA-like peptidoglycan-associated protein
LPSYADLLQKRKIDVVRALTKLLFVGLILSLISGCTMKAPAPGDGCWKAGTILGGMAGGLAGGLTGSAFSQKLGPRLAAGFGGAAVGALAGGLGEYYLVGCAPVPPPPPPVAQAAPPPPPSPPPLKTKPKIVLRGVLFDFNKAKIRPGDAAVLDEAAEILKSHPSVVVNVNGYCDAIGSETYNLKLSQRRAEAVARYLEQHGVPGAHLIPHGYGKTNFVAPNDTAEGRAQNRRVEWLPVE